MHKESLNIVGIGASAGGLEAIREFFYKMPSESGLAFVAIQDLWPNSKNVLLSNNGEFMFDTNKIVSGATLQQR